MTKYRAEDRVRESITSLGIDIGTTTTCLIISRLATARLGGTHAMARVEIVDRQVVYRSPVVFTPVTDQNLLDSEAIFGWVNGQLEQAGLAWGKVDSGAVIITGESAQRANAQAVVSELADRAGRFVVATAGPSLEAILAGRGAGAATLSRQGRRVLNLDVGGGTTNGVLFADGEPATTLCAHVGGRLVRLDPFSARILSISPPAQRVVDELGLDLRAGARADPAQLWLLCTAMAEGLDQLLQGGQPSAVARALLIGPPLAGPVQAEQVTFSGGVGREIYQESPPISLADVARYGDIGPMLAAALRQGPTIRRFHLREPPETVYATVIGAGMEVLELSGSTIFLRAEGFLPIHNLPMVRPPGLLLTAPPDQIAHRIMEALTWFGTEGTGPDQPVALAIPGLKHPSFARVVNMAQGIAHGVAGLVQRQMPVVVVLEENIGNVLGNSLAELLPRGHPLICIDQIRAGTGDYIDIGEPLYGGMVVPVVVKSLVFHT